MINRDCREVRNINLTGVKDIFKQWASRRKLYEGRQELELDYTKGMLFL